LPDVRTDIKGKKKSQQPPKYEPGFVRKDGGKTTEIRSFGVDDLGKNIKVGRVGILIG